MKTSTIVWTIVVIVIIVLGGWYIFMMPSAQPVVAPSTDTGLNNSPSQTNTGQASVTPVLKVSSNATLGSYLVASNGMTLYMFTKDTANVSNCTGACATAWPPYSPTANEPLVASDSVTGQLSTITRADGTKQLTYKSVPLYFFAKDANPGDTLGQNVLGVWFVVKP
jgi:predicted lipoprotein with Yx(FWY)xxD motif